MNTKTILKQSAIFMTMLAGLVLSLASLTHAEVDITTGLIAHWKFDEGSGTVAGDSSGNGNNGTLVNGPVWRQGLLEGALEFDGTNDYVDLGDVLNPANTSLTVGLWFKWDGKQGENILYNKENLYTARIYNGQFQYAWSPHWTWDGGTSFPVTQGEWYHATLVYDKSTQRLYKNGELVYSRDQTGDMGTNTSKLLFGARGNTTPKSYFDGTIDDIRIYNRALTPEEIASLASLAPQMPPQAHSQNITVLKNFAENITLTAYDINKDTLTYTILTQPSNGTLAGTAPNLSYTPNPDFIGSDSFTFKVNDVYIFRPFWTNLARASLRFCAGLGRCFG